MLQSDLLYSVAKPPQEPKEQRIKIIYWEVPVPYVEVQVGNLSIKLSLLQCRDFAGDLLAAADKAEANTEVAVIDAAYRKAAKAQYEEEGEIEVDDNLDAAALEELREAPRIPLGADDRSVVHRNGDLGPDRSRRFGRLIGGRR